MSNIKDDEVPFEERQKLFSDAASVFTVGTLGPKHPAPQFTKLRGLTDDSEETFWNGFDKGYENGVRDVQKRVAKSSLWQLFLLRRELRGVIK